MHYNYGEIVNFDFNELYSAASYFHEKETSFLLNMSKVEIKHSQIQDEFNVYHPNITILIGGYPFLKAEKEVLTEGTIELLVGDSNALLEYVYDGGISISNNLVIDTSLIEETLDFVSFNLLSKNSRTHDVFWTYRMNDETSGDIHLMEGHDFPSYISTSNSFFQKRLETFDSIYSKILTVKDDSVFTKKIGMDNFNYIGNTDIYFDSRNIEGDTFTLDDEGKLSTDSPVAIKTSNIVFDLNTSVHEKSPMYPALATKRFAKIDLSNVVSFLVRSVPLESRSITEIVSSNNVASAIIDIYDVNEIYVPDVLKVEVSKENDAATFRSAMQLLTTMLNGFYTERLKLFLSKTIDFGPLADMIEYINSKIIEFKSSYVKNTECDVPLNSIDEGCDISCDNIRTAENNLMVTKQKLKSIIKCSLKCDTMPFTDAELSEFMYPPTNSKDEVSFGQPNI